MKRMGRALEVRRLIDQILDEDPDAPVVASFVFDRLASAGRGPRPLLVAPGALPYAHRQPLTSGFSPDGWSVPAALGECRACGARRDLECCHSRHP
ncbi:hypothetical protein ACIF80_16770 [Streptomyces sp. NPDC085927]|uniref:hypothetical protein n=1 Tax=Streptomyces sp. NPDC085927 TaxID=3365738 RepID=UPI0037D89F5F